MKVLEPVLIRVSAEVAPAAAAGAVTEIDMNFGSLEGAQLIGVEYFEENALDGVTGQGIWGLSFNPAQASPASARDIVDNEDCFALSGRDEVLATSGLENALRVQYVDLEKMKLLITRNLSLLCFTEVGAASEITARIYFKRVIFSQSELGTFAAVRR